MSRGKRFDDAQKMISPKKIIVIILVIAIVFAFVRLISNLLKKEDVKSNSFTEISYFTVYNNGKWGVINSKGDTVIEPEDTEMIIIPNAKKDVFICTYDVDYSAGTYKTKAVNSKKEDLYTTYSNIEAISNFKQDKNIWYESNCLKVQKDDKYGLIDMNGNEILSCVYDKIETIKGIENSLLVQKEGSYGLVNASGNIVIEPQYDQINSVTNDYKNGYIVKNKDGQFGIIGIDKTQILDCKYQEIKQVCGDGYYVAKENDKWLLVKNSTDEGKEVVDADIKSINSGYIVAVKNEKYGILDTELNEKVAFDYSYLEYVFGDYYIAKKDDKFGVINSSNEEKIGYEYNSLSYDKKADCLVGTKPDDTNKYLINRSLEPKVTCSDYTVKDGYIRANVENNYKFYNLKLEERNNREVYPNNTLYANKNEDKYGLENKDGKLVVSNQYEDITDQNEYGFVAVKKDGKWGIIDQYGNVTAETKFELDDISKITFVGKWHSAENVNTTYFVCE